MFVVCQIARIVKKSKVKSWLIELGKLRLGFIILTLLYFEKHNNILSLIDIDAHIKFIHD